MNKQATAAQCRVNNSLDQRKASGAHYTPGELAGFVARQILDYYPPGNDALRVLDPAVGGGELLSAMLCQAVQSDHRISSVCGFDTDNIAVEVTRERISRSHPGTVVDLRHDNFLDIVLRDFGGTNGSLFSASATEPEYDSVIANPPYVRTQVMGAEQSQALARGFGLSGRVDLYYAFIQGIARVLKPSGIAGIIVSNRFMTTRSGAGVRRSIREQFDILHVWDLGDTRLFEAAVLPAVLLLQRKGDMPQTTSPTFTSIYHIPYQSDTSARCASLMEALTMEGVVEVANDRCYRVQHGRLDFHGDALDSVWRISTDDTAKWLATVHKHTWGRFRDIGKIRVGVKTTADKVFVRSDWEKMDESERPELLRPLATHHSARRFKATTLEHPFQVLYTHCVDNGKRMAVDLSNYPKAARYLEHHRERLESRTYIMEAGRNWYELWVPQDPAVWIHPKIVFRDIVEQPTFWMDLDGSVVNGDCYWLTLTNPKNQDLDLLWLALAVGNSTFIEDFYDRQFNNKLYANRRRFITQYVEEFPLPDPMLPISKKIVEMVKEIYDLVPSGRSDQLEIELDGLIHAAFGLAIKEGSR